MRSTRLDLKGISVHAHHGVHPEERESGQRFLVDVACGIAHPVIDSISASVDYALLAERVHALVAGDRLDLIESVADRVAAACLEDERVEWAEVTVHKPAVVMPVPVGDVSVTVRRTREDLDD